MKTYVQPGEVITVTAPYALTSGLGCQVGDALWGVATANYDSGATDAELFCKPGAVVTIAKTSALAISVGDRLYWDNTNKVVNKTASSQLCVGVAVEAAANPSSTVKMRIGGVQPNAA